MTTTEQQGKGQLVQQCQLPDKKPCDLRWLDMFHIRLLKEYLHLQYKHTPVKYALTYIIIT